MTILGSSSSSLETMRRRLSGRMRLVSYSALPKPDIYPYSPRSKGIPNTATFVFNKEDHTLGNLLTARLHKYDYVTFSAYKVPHPLLAKFEMRVSTDGTVSPKDAIVRACRDIVQDLEILSRGFTTEWLGKRIVSEGEQEISARERAL